MIYPFVYSVFPDLLSYTFLATGIWRVILAVIWFNQSKQYNGTSRAFLISLSVMLAVGLLTQIIALILGIVAVYNWYITKDIMKSNFYFLLSAATFTLLFFGAGAFAFDLPI